MSAVLLEFDLEEEIARLRRDDAIRGGRAARTLVKQPDLRIVLTVIQAGTRMPEHKAAGRLSVQTVKGRIRMRVARAEGAEVVDMPAGRLLLLDRDVPHDVEAVVDSAFLLTLVMPAAAGG